MFYFKHMEIASCVPGNDVGSYARPVNSYRYFFADNFEAVSLQIMLGFSCASSSTKRTLTRPPPRINPRYRIGRIAPEVDPTFQPNRIRRYEPANVRIVIAERVVVQSRVPIQVLPLKPQVLLLGFVLGLIAFIQRMDSAAIKINPLPFLGLRVAPGLVGGLPDELALAVG